MTETISEALKPGTIQDLNEKRAAMIALIKEAKKKQKLVDKHASTLNDIEYSKMKVKEKRELQAKIRKLLYRAEEKLFEIEREIQAKTLGPDVLKTIGKQCSEIIALYKKTGKVLFRGFGGEQPRMFIGRPQENRRPVDSGLAAQQAFDQMLTKLKIAAQRSNSLFTCSDIMNAEGYGTVYVIFPKNGFKFSYTSVSDLVVYDDTVPWSVNTKSPQFKLLNKFITQWRIKLQSDEYENSDTYLKEHAVERFLDAVRNCEGVRDMDDALYYIREELDPPAAIRKIKATDLVVADLAAMAKKYKPTNKNLNVALKSGVEVLILGEYYAVKLRDANQVLKYFGIKQIKNLDDSDDF